MNYQDAHEMVCLLLQQGNIEAYSVKLTKEKGKQISLFQNGEWTKEPWYIENIPKGEPVSMPLCHACDSLAITRKNKELIDSLYEIIEHDNNLNSRQVPPTGSDYTEILDMIKKAYLKFFRYNVN